MDDIKKWFCKNQRDLPWRTDRTPYRVWISEVMLQQTRAATVIDYFERWMDAFPTVEKLGSASLEEVIKLWEGLGYYSRARNLHAGAKQIMEEFSGLIPDTYDKLMSIKGIGPYTAAAILSFGFEQKAAALDGNVMRVLSRYLGFEKELPKHADELRKELFHLLPSEDPHIVMEGLIELGAMICDKNPKCGICPIEENCIASQTRRQLALPVKKQRVGITELHRFVACIESEGMFLVRQTPKGEVMADLFEFPYVENAEGFQEIIEKKLGLVLERVKDLAKEVGHFTRYRAHFYPVHFLTKKPLEVVGYKWMEKTELQTIPFSSAHGRIKEAILATCSP